MSLLLATFAIFIFGVVMAIMWFHNRGPQTSSFVLRYIGRSINSSHSLKNDCKSIITVNCWNPPIIRKKIQLQNLLKYMANVYPNSIILAQEFWDHIDLSDFPKGHRFIRQQNQSNMKISSGLAIIVPPWVGKIRRIQSHTYKTEGVSWDRFANKGILLCELQDGITIVNTHMQSNDDASFDKTNVITKNVWNKQFFELKGILEHCKGLVVLGGDFNRPIQDLSIPGLQVYPYNKIQNTNTTQGQIDGFFQSEPGWLGEEFFDGTPLKHGFTDHVIVGHRLKS